ncbi:MAG: YebC/PmpR family DNA-binding transcriptional regulator [Propionibacteriaceae bacterium]|jgi:YebC/PmpR family DNA-binding regulatory protein|nr:YebC/PmpR family DNA-binding transcriptional regulator [Propionibacteriaceae bacterium]
MSGHSKWATTKHKKAAIDAKRGKLFARLIKNIEVAARTGGPDPAGNPTLYDAIQKAKKNSVPADNIDRAVKRAAGGEGGGADWTTIMYEAYAAGGVAILIECLTDNRNRSASDVRIAVTRNGGRMADMGSVQRLFERKGVVEVEVKDGKPTEDEVMEATLDAGAEDIKAGEDTFTVYCDPNDLVEVRKAVQNAGFEYEKAEVDFVPTFTESITDLETARKVYKVLDALDDLDDVQNVYSNEDVPEEIEAQLDEE